MTDAEAKRCLERIIEIEKQYNRDIYSLRREDETRPKRKKEAAFEIKASIICIILSIGAFFLADYWSTSGSGEGFFGGLLTELLSGILGFIWPFTAVGCLIWLISSIIKFAKINNEQDKTSEIKRLESVNERLEKEENQLKNMLCQKCKFDQIDFHPEIVLKHMNRGRTFRDALWDMKNEIECRRSIAAFEDEYERKRKREQAEKDYRQAVLNEQRRTNENLENLQRQQEYANRLAREAEFQREYEDLKRRVNKKWGE